MPTTRESQGVPGTSGQQQESTVRKQQHIAMRRGSSNTTTTTTLPSPSRHYIQFFPMDNDHDVSLYRGRHHHQHQQRYTFYYEPYQSTQRRHRQQQQRHSSKSSSPLFPSLPSSSSASPTSSFCPNDEPLIFHSDVMDDTAIFDDFNQLAADQDTFIPSSSPSTTVIDDDFVLFP